MTEPLVCTECMQPITSPWFFREEFPNPDAAFCGLHRPPQRRWRRFMFRCQRCGIETDGARTPPPNWLFLPRGWVAEKPDLRRRYCVGGCR